MDKILFDSEVIEMKEINGKIIVKCANPIYEIKKNKNGKLYKYCLSNKCRTKKIGELLEAMRNESLTK